MTTSSAAQPKCQHCGQDAHVGKCPLVKAIEYHENGTIKRVEYMTPADQFPPLSPWPAPMPGQPMPPWTPTWSDGPR